MKTPERAAQMWAVLALAATNRQILTYKMLSRLTGVPAASLGKFLEPIQSYCLLNNLPPLTILVVGMDDGLPGSGFTAATDIPRNQNAVFAHDWLGTGAPSPDALAEAVAKHPSNG